MPLPARRAPDDHADDGDRAFVRPKFTFAPPEACSRDALATLPDLVAFSAAHNPRRLFCLQFSRDADAPPVRVTFAQLHAAVLCCAVWLAGKGLAQPPRVVDGETVKARPVALFMGSDVGWFVVFLALLRVGVPVLSMSTRLSPQAILHLLKTTNAQAVLTSPQVQGVVEDTVSAQHESGSASTDPIFLSAPSYSELLRDDGTLDASLAPPATRVLHGDDRNVVILHSSGTTGLPKPIYHSHAYLLGYAACHRLSPHDTARALALSTLPLYHGFGLLAPCLALSTGMPLALPASTAVPTGASVLALLRAARATALLTVPHVLEELHQLPGAVGTEALRALRVVAVGGAAMKQSVAGPLVAAGVPLLNHWGVTEIGAIAPIVIPPPLSTSASASSSASSPTRPEHDWRYLHLRDDIPLRLEPLPCGHHRLVGSPPGSTAAFTVQDLLLVHPAAPATHVRIAGRADDLLVLATGEKVRPAALEAALGEDARVGAALAFGAGRFQVGVLVEAAAHVVLDLADEEAVAAYVESIWPSVERANPRSDAHAVVARDMVLVTTPRARPLVRTPKGSVPRAPNVELFAQEIDAAYDRLHHPHHPYNRGDGAHVMGDEDAARRIVRAEVRAALGRALPDDDTDFFEHGMDSLQASTLRRRLGAALPADVVYAHATIARLARALCGNASSYAEGDRCKRMEALLEEYTRRLGRLLDIPVAQEQERDGSRPGEEPGAVRPDEKPSAVRHDGAAGAGVGNGGLQVLVIGSTGSLGGALLAALVADAGVGRVYALNRRVRARQDSQRDLRARQEDALRLLGADLGDDGWKKVVLLEGDLAAERFGLAAREWDDLRGVTHVVHNAWPMNFNHKLESFRPQFELVLSVVRLALTASSATGRPTNILFSSSIAAVGRHTLLHGASGPVAETPQTNPDVAERLGYAEAKWVCERLYEAASAQFPNRVAATSIRMGQLAGCIATAAWNTEEHIPMIVKACQAVGRIPLLPGDASWLPVDHAGAALADMVLANAPLPRVLHLENPRRRAWGEILQIVGDAMGTTIERDRVPFAEWLERVRALPDPVANPAGKVLAFLEDAFIRLATGVLDTTAAQSVSAALRTAERVPDELILRYLEGWKRTGWLV